MDASAGQITQESTVADVPKLDFARVNPVAARSMSTAPSRAMRSR